MKEDHEVVEEGLVNVVVGPVVELLGEVDATDLCTQCSCDWGNLDPFVGHTDYSPARSSQRTVSRYSVSVNEESRIGRRRTRRVHTQMEPIFAV